MPWLIIIPESTVMELQRINSISLGMAKDGKSGVMESDDYQTSMDKIVDRLTTKGDASKPERGQITAACFDMSILAIFFGMSTGRIGMLARDQTKYGNIEDVKG
jgi:hypothetical protein